MTKGLHRRENVSWLLILKLQVVVGGWEEVDSGNARYEFVMWEIG